MASLFHRVFGLLNFGMRDGAKRYVVAEAIARWKQRRTDFEWVCAIDFGTSTTGFIFQQKGEPRPKFYEWGDGQIKTQTAVLLNETGGVELFGSEATEAYYLNRDQVKNYLYFSCFKMQLYTYSTNELPSAGLFLQATNGKSKPACDVIAKVLKHLKDLFMKRTSIAGCAPDADKVLWVITVPAIWSNAAKQLMRRAAEAAGLCTQTDHSHVKLVHEPEAAGVYCSTLEASQFKGDRREACAPSNKDKFLVIDLGGGTVDISVLLAEGSGQYRVCHKVSGGPWGSTVVDEGILDVFNLLDKENFEDWKKQKPGGYVKLLVTIKKLKESWDGKKDSHCVVGVPVSLYRMIFRSRNPREVAKEASDKYKRILSSSYRLGEEENLFDYNEEDGELVLHSVYMQDLFSRCSGNIIKHLESMQEAAELADVGRAYLVGGFAKSSHIQRTLTAAIKAMLPDIQVLTPVEARGAILLGAVNLGLQFAENKEVIVSRVADRTYGVGCSKLYDEAVHAGRDTFVDSNKKYCNNCFSTIVRRGDVVKVGEERRVRLDYLEEHQEAGSLTTWVYSSTERDVRFTDDPHCVLEAKLTSSFPPSEVTTERRSNTKVFCFESTEVQVVVVDDDTGGLHHTTVDFLPSNKPL